MKRRDFIYLSGLFLTSSLLAKNNSKTNAWEIIQSTLEHLFPKKYFSYNGNTLDFKTFTTLGENLKYLSKEDYDFLFQGAKELYSIEKNFTSLAPNKKEKTLRNFEKTTMGYNWLNTLHSMSIEAMFSDPIYLGNTQGFAYKKFSHNPGFPQPTKRYVYGL